MKNTWHESLLEYVVSGDLWIAPILLCALLALLITIFKAVQLYSLPRLCSKLDQHLKVIMKSSSDNRRGLLINLNSEVLSGMQASLFAISLSTPLGQVRNKLIYSELMQDKQILENWIQTIGALSAIPLCLGLLATLTGQTLITLELSVMAALPVLAVNSLLAHKVKAYYAELESCATQLNQLPTGSN